MPCADIGHLEIPSAVTMSMAIDAGQIESRRVTLLRNAGISH
jgi:hypothetical protein